MIINTTATEVSRAEGGSCTEGVASGLGFTKRSLWWLRRKKAAAHESGCVEALAGGACRTPAALVWMECRGSALGVGRCGWLDRAEARWWGRSQMLCSGVGVHSGGNQKHGIPVLSA